MQTNKKMIAGLGLVSVAGIAGSALAASITIGGTPSAGQGTTVVSGYTVESVEYRTAAETSTNATSIADVVKVQFVLKKAGAAVTTNTGNTVWAQLRTGTSGTTPLNWATCTYTTANSLNKWVCAVTGAQATALDSVTGLSVVAYDSTAP